jgi:hypothetical protein
MRYDIALVAQARRGGPTAVHVPALAHDGSALARGLYDQVAERSGFIVYRKQLG